MTQNPDTLVRDADAIINSTAKDVCKQWLKQVRPSEGVLIRQQRLRSAIMVTVYLLERHKTVPQDHKRLITSAVYYYKCSRKKIMNYVNTVKFFSEKDYECTYILQLLAAPALRDQRIDLYLKTRQVIISGPFNTRKKDQLSGVLCPLEEWFTAVSQVYNSANPKALLERFTLIVKNHYTQIKKDQNSDLNGAEVLNIIDKLSEIFPQSIPTRPPARSPTKSTSKLMTETEQMNSVGYQNLKAQKINGLLELKHDRMIKQMTSEVDELRNGLLKEQEKITKMTERQRYFISFIKQAKQEVFELAESLLDKRLQQPALDKLLSRFEQFQLNIQKRESPDMVRINNKRDELRLIYEITREQMTRTGSQSL